MINCLECNKNLSGKQTKFCSNKCSRTWKVRENKLQRHKEKALKPKANCASCEKPLPEGQRKHCSRLCFYKYRGRNIEYRKKVYKKQNQKAYEIKLKLISLLGGQCQVCGYKKNSASLCFHHKEPSIKSFEIVARHCANRTWETILQESKKCLLLCHNCHYELHFPNLSIL
jgi:hypothetical protein